MALINIYEGLISISNRILVSFFILFVGLLFAGLFEKFARFALSELRINELLKKGLNFNIDARGVISKLIYYVSFFGTIILSLNNLNLTWYVIVTWIIFITTIFALSFLLDVKDNLKNIYYRQKLGNKIKKNNVIQTDIIEGKVIKKSLFGVTLLYNDEEHYVPNVFLNNGYIIKK